MKGGFGPLFFFVKSCILEATGVPVSQTDPADAYTTD